MNEPLFTGVCTALVTPFLNGQINYPMMEMLLRRQMDAGIKSVVISGTTGEAPTLSDDEKITLFRRCKEYVGNTMQIIAGTGSNDTAHAVALSIAAQEAGADALLVVSPYYNKATPEGIVAHYLSIAHSVRLPVIVYNVPGRTGLDIPVSVYQRLSRIPNIAGIKEASVSMEKILSIQHHCGKDLTVWSGNDDLTVPVISLGGKGVISVASNIAPAEMKCMVDAALDGDFDTAAQIQCQLYPLTKLLFQHVNPIPVKAALACIGYDCGTCRLPLTPLTQEQEQEIRSFFN